MSNPHHALLVLPDGLSVYKRTPEWNEHTVPPALLKDHTTKQGVWGRIVVLEGTLLYVVESQGASLELSEGRVGVVLPTVPHRVEPLGSVRFFLEFLQYSVSPSQLPAPVPFEVWTDPLGAQRYLHGTKADLKPGDLIEPGRASNYGERTSAAFVYLTGTLDAATWGAELAIGEGPGRIYIVEPTGPIDDDPNLTDKKFPGNPTRSFRTREPLRVAGEINEWKGHAPEQLQAMREGLAQLAAQGIKAIED